MRGTRSSPPAATAPEAPPIAVVGLVGGGVMGAGIAEVCARAGLDVRLAERDAASAAAATERLRRSLHRGVRRGKLTEDEAQEAEGRIEVVTSLDGLADCDVAIEAVPEIPDVKRPVLAELDRLMPDAPFIGTNTSSIPIGALAAATSRPERVVGVHFANPVVVSPLVELIPSMQTAPEALAVARAFAERDLGRTTIVAPDRAGFVVNALFIPFLLSAIRMLEAGLATAEDIDKGVSVACAMPLGPLAVADLLGLDVVRFVGDTMYRELRDPSVAPPPLLVRMVEAGRLGRKSGRGFYTYDADGARVD
jgi:3-hydroxybutyryl-CoA dehydrogenase